MYMGILPSILRVYWDLRESSTLLGGFDGGESNIYRENDGVSFVRQVETQRRIKIILNSFENVTINRYEDKLKSPSL